MTDEANNARVVYAKKQRKQTKTLLWNKVLLIPCSQCSSLARRSRKSKKKLQALRMSEHTTTILGNLFSTRV